MAFIWAADSDDVRSEGMSYGMMIAVQMNLQAQFDRLWKFAKTYMQFPGDQRHDRLASLLPLAGDGEPRQRHQLDGQLPRPRPAPRPTATNTSRRRSTSRTGAGAATGAINYKLEADNIAAAMLHNTSTHRRPRPDHSRQPEHGGVLSPGRLGHLHRPQLPPAGVLRAVRGGRARGGRRQVALGRRHQPRLPGHLGARHHRAAPRLRDVRGRADDGGGRRRPQRLRLRRLARGDEHGGRLRLGFG